MIRQGNVARAMSGYALLAVCAVGGLTLAVAPSIAQQEPPPTEQRQREQLDQQLRAQQEAELARARADEAQAQAIRAQAAQAQAQAHLAQAQAEMARAAADAQRGQALRGRLMDDNPEVAQTRQRVQNLRRQLAEAERHLADISPDDPTLRRPQGQIINNRLGVLPPGGVGNPANQLPQGPRIAPPIRVTPQELPGNPPLNPQPSPVRRATIRAGNGEPGQPGMNPQMPPQLAPQEARRLDQIEKQLQELAAAVRDLKSQNNPRTPSPRDGEGEGLPRR